MTDRYCRSRRPHPRTLRAAAEFTALLASAVILTSAGSPGPSALRAATDAAQQQPWHQLCAVPTETTAGCDVLEAEPSTLLAAPGAAPAGYGPADLRAAYHLPADGGAGQTIAVIDAYDDPNAESDLGVYRKQYGLPACTTANGCFRKVNADGRTSPLPAKAGANQGAEDSLDLDLVSAVAPDAKIIFVEAASAKIGDIGAAVNQAVRLGAKFVSNSYIFKESSSDSSYDRNYYNHPGVAMVAGSGDWDYAWGVGYPSSSPYVTSVGGTSLARANNSRGWTEKVWNTKAGEGTGSGCSGFEAKPSWQKDKGCTRRMATDVSAVADPSPGLAVYDSYQKNGWGAYGGTSASTPIIAGVYADAGAPSAGSNPAAFPYAHPGDLNDVTTGANGTCSPSYFCTAGTGYDGPTGLGTPNGTAAFRG